MKKKLSKILVLMMILCLAMPMNVYATAVSDNDLNEDVPVEDEDVSVDDEVVDEDTPTEDIPAEEPPVDEPPTEEPSVEEEVEEVEEEPSGGGTLTVDGYYDDWENVPETLITYGSHNTSGNVNEHHGAAMIVTDDYVYIRVRMSDLYHAQIPVDELKFTINGQERTFVIRGRDEANRINWGTNVYNLSAGTYNELGVFYRDGGNVALGEAIMTVNGASGGDRYEFRMSIAELEALYGLPAGSLGNGAKLEFYSPNIGPQRVTVVGTSTGTYWGIALCAFVLFAAMLREKTRKQA